MEAEGSGSKVVAGVCQWTPTQSTFVLSFLSNIVANGTRTSTGFKKVHLNSCAKALNEHFKLNRTGDQIGNHLKTWKNKYTKINRLRKLSAAIWEEDTLTITLDHEHYTGHVATHKADDEYLYKPLQYYGYLATIFGNSVATGQYAKGSNDPLGTAGDDGENEGEDDGATATATATAGDSGATHSGSRPNKRAKFVDSDGDGLVVALKESSEKISDAIKEAAKADNTLPPGLFETVNNLPGFEHNHKSSYFLYLVNNAHIARAFSSLPLDHQITWVAKFVTGNL